jgi:peroxiredoxin
MRHPQMATKVSYRATNIRSTFIIGISETLTFARKRNIHLITNNIKNIRLIIEYTYTLTFF